MIKKRMTADEATQTSRFARLKTDKYELEEIVTAISSLDEVSVKNIPKTTHTLTTKCTLHPDVKRSSLPVEVVLQQAPDTDDNCFRVPQFLIKQ